MSKKLLIGALVLFGYASSSFAWKSTEPVTKLYTFHFEFKGESLEIRRPAGSYEDAFQEAADTCFKHFKGQKRLMEEEGLDLIDVCANPRS